MGGPFTPIASLRRRYKNAGGTDCQAGAARKHQIFQWYRFHLLIIEIEGGDAMCKTCRRQNIDHCTPSLLVIPLFKFAFYALHSSPGLLECYRHVALGIARPPPPRARTVRGPPRRRRLLHTWIGCAGRGRPLLSSGPRPNAGR